MLAVNDVECTVMLQILYQMFLVKTISRVKADEVRDRYETQNQTVLAVSFLIFPRVFILLISP